MSFQVSVVDASPAAFACRADQAVLAAMAGAGQGCLQVGCRSGGCGVCRVQVIEGAYECGTMSVAQVSAADRGQGIALACQLFPRGDLRLRALGKLGCDEQEPTRALFRAISSSARTSSERA